MNFQFNDPEAMVIILRIAGSLGVDPYVPIESEEYFIKILNEYSPQADGEFGVWLHYRISKDFVAFGKRPIWIQGAEWPFCDGDPMIFVGQIDIDSKQVNGYFHDDAAIYAFLAKGGTGEIVTITQTF